MKLTDIQKAPWPEPRLGHSDSPLTLQEGPRGLARAPTSGPFAIRL